MCANLSRRFHVVGFSTIALGFLTAGSAFGAQNCAGEVQTAVAKQHGLTGYRVSVSSPVKPDGATETIDYQPPLKMYRRIKSPDQDFEIETIGFGNRAWSREGGGWFELKPHIASMVETHLRDMFGNAPKVVSEFTCLGKVTYEGKEYVGYQTVPEKGDTGDLIARTIYADPATGLPAYNIVGEAKGTKPALVREAYSYPTDIAIEIPENAPAAP
jgi:hypothetical protein